MDKAEILQDISVDLSMMYKKALKNIQKLDPKTKKEFAKADRFIGIRHMNDWAVIRQIDKANGVSYDCK